jgi:hypothetical protein
MFDRIVARAVERELDRRANLNGHGGHALPTGYLPLEVIRGAMLSWVFVPFAGVGVWCELRTLNSTQQEACGAFSLIDTDEEKTKPPRAALIDMRNGQERLARAVLNRPRFEEIETMLLGVDFVAADKRRELEAIKKIDLSSCSAEEKAEIERDTMALELSLAFFLPEDTLDFLTRWALGVNVSDIKKLNRAALLDAAILATNGHDSPHDHISGTFTDRDAADIDKTAWSVYIQDQEEKKGLRNGVNWVFGGGK